LPGFEADVAYYAEGFAHRLFVLADDGFGKPANPTAIFAAGTYQIASEGRLNSASEIAVRQSSMRSRARCR